MTAPNNKPVPPDVLARFQAYYNENPAWGSLHVVLADHNMEDYWVQGCIDRAVARGEIGRRFAWPLPAEDEQVPAL